MAKRGLVLLPPEGKLSLIHADDLARLLIALASPVAPAGLLVEPDDGQAGGLTHREFASLLGFAVGKRPRTLAVPAGLVRAAARIDRLLRGANAKLTPDRAGYFCHPDWVADPELAVPASLWSPQIGVREGLRETARWYKAKDWL